MLCYGSGYFLGWAGLEECFPKKTVNKRLLRTTKSAQYTVVISFFHLLSQCNKRLWFRQCSNTWSKMEISSWLISDIFDILTEVNEIVLSNCARRFLDMFIRNNQTVCSCSASKGLSSKSWFNRLYFFSVLHCSFTFTKATRSNKRKFHEISGPSRK